MLVLVFLLLIHSFPPFVETHFLQVEYCLLSVLSFFAFSSEITENVDRGLSTTDTIPAESLGSFLLQVCNFVDIGKTLSQSSDNMCESLVVKQGSHV